MRNMCLLLKRCHYWFRDLFKLTIVRVDIMFICPSRVKESRQTIGFSNFGYVGTPYCNLRITKYVGS